MGRIFDKDGLNCIEPPATTPTPRLVSTLSCVQQKVVWTGCGRDEEVAREMMMNCYEDHFHPLAHFIAIFIGPGSDQWLCLSLTD